MSENDDRARTDAVYTCQGCGAVFSSRADLHLHNAETHGGGSTGGSSDEPAGGRAGEPPTGSGYVGS
ncbi:MAG TPA: hypothetical protein VLA82_01460 [Actinomycetota bacterium]|nr:hypothetical protein [Actinomycetota bacterium]